MKLPLLFLPIFIMLLMACAPQAMDTPLSAPVTTDTLIVITTSESMQTLEPTPVSMPVSEISLDSCRQIVEAKISDTGILEIVFDGNNNSLSNSFVSGFGFSDSGQRISSAIWSDDTQKSVPFPLPLDALGPKISSDHRWLLFRRDATETQSEFWVIGIDGKDAKKFGSVQLDEATKAKYPDGLFSLNYGWIPNTASFFLRG